MSQHITQRPQCTCSRDYVRDAFSDPPVTCAAHAWDGGYAAGVEAERERVANATYAAYNRSDTSYAPARGEPPATLTAQELTEAEAWRMRPT